MADLLLDTNAISAGMRGDPAFLRYLERIDGNTLLVTSVIIEGEIRFGLSRLPDGRKKRSLTTAFVEVRDGLHDILAVTPRIAAQYAQAKGKLWARGRPIGENDLWIAATALAHRLILVTNDTNLPPIEDLVTENWTAAS